MEPRPQYPIHVPPEYLFAPADGIQYTTEDIPRAFAQQPIRTPSLPAYLIPSPNTTTLRPPFLHYGWKLGSNKLLEIAQKHFPDVVEYRFAPAREGLDDHDEDYPPEEYLENKPNVGETIFNGQLLFAIYKYIDLPVSRAPTLINVRLLNDSEGDEWGLTVGSNYDGVIERVFLDKLQTILETEEPPMWYLDIHDCEWYRVPSPIAKVKAKTTAKSKGMAKSTKKAKSADEAKSVDKATKAIKTTKAKTKMKKMRKARTANEGEDRRQGGECQEGGRCLVNSLLVALLISLSVNCVLIVKLSV
ncbi:hypothetical protein L227DRAFT_577720 [Lentinus tigrinus ALCF2SS1-6]|uniref:Uncharacterized protein n=1 Tax=Lentinus tigrinus ALCF2SS1-6 TaxID=1328759 RepID=A0A5C2S2S5_9APHY|nr:hypothetical protein L227DRAFT_577720 [Lentinus tigrinus ALCF2SS1-6]